MPDLIRIERADDPRVEGYRAVRERDLAGREGLFVAESEGVVRTLLSPASRFAVESVLLAENRVEGLRCDLERGARAAPVYVAPRAVLAEVAGFPIHRGVLALGRRGGGLDVDALLAGLPAAATVLVLVGLTNHDNVGAVFRNAAAFGAAAVLLDGATCDPLYRKAIRVSVGACLTVPFARLGRAEAIVDRLVAAGFAPLALSPAGREDVAGVARDLAVSRAALLLGTEGDGLPPALMVRCRTICIPMAAGHDSLNVAAAGAIALHHLFAARSGGDPERERDKGRRLPPA